MTLENDGLKDLIARFEARDRQYNRDTEQLKRDILEQQAAFKEEYRRDLELLLTELDKPEKAPLPVKNDHLLLEIVKLTDELKAATPNAIINSDLADDITAIDLLIDLILELEDEGAKGFQGAFAHMHACLEE